MIQVDVERGSPTPKVAHSLSAVASLLLRAGLLVAPLLFLAGAFALTLGHDEAWILSGVRGLATSGRFGSGSPIAVVHSTGGLHVVVTAILHALGGGAVVVIRLSAVAAMCALLAILYLWARHHVGRGPSPLIIAASPLTVSGTHVFAAQAYGAGTAMVLALGGLIAWGSFAAGSWRRRVLTGLLLGSAVATRLNFAVSLLVPIALAAFSGRGSRRNAWLDGAFATIVGALTAFGELGVLVLDSENILSRSSAFGGYGLGLDASSLAYVIPVRLGALVVGEGFLPISAMLLVTAGWSCSRGFLAEGPASSVDALLVFGWLAWGAWVFRAPIPHLRYLWPALVAIIVVGTTTLCVAVRAWCPREGGRAAVMLPVGMVVAVAFGHARGLRDYLVSDSDVLSWQWSHETRFTYQYGPLRPVLGQTRLVRVLAAGAPGEGISTIGMSPALGYLLRRDVLPIESYYSPVAPATRAFLGRKPRWLVLDSRVNRHPAANMRPELYAWIARECRLKFREGGWALYEIVGDMPASADVFATDAYETRLPFSQ